MAVLSPVAKQQFFTDAGTPAAGYLLYTYAANTTTPQATYTNKAGTVANTNPIVLDSRGEAIIYLDPALTYDYVLKTAAGVTVWTREGVETDSGLASLAASTGSSLVGFLQAGTGAVARTLQEKGRESISVEDFGAVGDGVADDTAAIVAAYTYLASIGGGDLIFGNTTYKISTKIQVSANNVMFTGKGTSQSHDVGLNVPGTVFLWYGAAADTMVEFSPVVGASNQRGSNGGMRGIALDGRSIANNGLVIKSWFGGDFDIYGGSCLRTIVEMNVVATLGEARDCQFNAVSIFGRQYAGAPSGATLIFEGDATANVSFNKFPRISSTYQNGNCLSLGNSDSNDFGLVRLNSGGGTGIGVLLGGSNVSTSETCRGNHFHMLSPGSGGITSQGTPTVTYPAYENVIDWFDDGNGSPDPVVQTGSTLRWTNQRAVRVGTALVHATIADSKANAQTQRALMGTESVRIINASSNHVRLTDGTSEWAVLMTGGNLQISRISGTGQTQFGNSTRFQAVGFQGTTPIGKPAVTGSRGGNAALASALTALANYGLITDSSTA